jgi:glycerophosphoryl diester phosphodiesterase
MKAESCLNRLCIGSEHDELGRRLTEVLPDALHFYPRDALAAFIVPVRGGDAPEDDGRYTVLDMPLRYADVTLFDAALAQAAANHGKWVNVWTVDDPNDMRRVIAEGVGGVMTDRPDLLRACLPLVA